MTDIVSVLSLINYGFVLIFGIIVSFYFAGIQWEDNKRLFILTTVLFVLFQALFYVLLGENVLFKCYPVLIHIPLILIIRYICHQNIYIIYCRYVRLSDVYTQKMVWNPGKIYIS